MLAVSNRTAYTQSPPSGFSSGFSASRSEMEANLFYRSAGAGSTGTVSSTIGGTVGYATKLVGFNDV